MILELNGAKVVVSDGTLSILDRKQPTTALKTD
jgi:hypothetical protein